MLVKDESTLFLLRERNSLVLGSRCTFCATFFRFAVEGASSVGVTIGSLERYVEAPAEPFTPCFGAGRFITSVE